MDGNSSPRSPKSLRWCRRGAFYRLPKFLSRHSLTKAANFQSHNEVTKFSLARPAIRGPRQFLSARSARPSLQLRFATCRHSPALFLIKRPLVFKSLGGTSQ
jgi:hypothetical protein